MALGTIAGKMLGFADEVMEGFAKGIGDAGTIRASVNKISSNMTPKQAKFLKNFGKNKADDAARAVSRSQAYYKGTKNTAANAFKQMGRDDLAQSALSKKGMPITKAQRRPSLNGTKIDRVAGIKDPTLGNKIGDALGGGIKDTYTSMKAGRGISQSLSDAYMDGDKLRTGRAVGTFVGMSAAARVATGGGLYKDRNGSTNIIGVPFI